MANVSEDKISTTEAGKILGITSQTIRTWIKSGDLQAVRGVRGNLLVHRAEILALTGKGQPAIEIDGSIDATKLYERLKRRVPNSLEFVRTLVEHGCDQGGVVTCCDEIFRSVARDRWEAMVRGHEFAFAHALAEFMEDWTYRQMTDAQSEQYMVIVKSLVNFIKVVEFGDEATAVEYGEGKEVSFTGYPVHV